MLDEKMKKMLENYNKGLDLYKNKNFQEALNYFQKALEYKPNDGPSNLYIERCKLYIKNPPPADWDGVFVMTTK